jgi:uncharacterized membrane protein (Fun14 family)
MSGIESNIMPLVSTIGFGGIVGFLVGFALKLMIRLKIQQVMGIKKYTQNNWQSYII